MRFLKNFNLDYPYMVIQPIFTPLILIINHFSHLICPYMCVWEREFVSYIFHMPKLIQTLLILNI